ncbi:MAG: cupin domain-containing protein [Candidatus Heimdallarchaeota archaeon]
MLQKRVYNLNKLEWKALRKDLTIGVSSKSLIPEELTDVKIVLTRVEPGGEFTIHQDPYHHVFYFIEGRGEGQLGDVFYEINSGLVVEVPAGELHGYKNTGEKDLLLFTVNIPIS